MTCGACKYNDDGFCDMKGILVEDDDSCWMWEGGYEAKTQKDCNGCFGAAENDCQKCW